MPVLAVAGNPVFTGQPQFRDRVTMTQPAGGARSALRLVGDNSVGQILELFDYLLAPIQATNTTGGDAVYGDRRGVYAPGDIFNPVFQIMGATADNLASTAGGVRIGRTTGQTEIFWGTGAPGAAYPVTTGIPGNGGMYWRKDGGVGTTLYRVVTGAWTPTAL